MTFLHIAEQGLPRHPLGERRNDHATANKIRNALQARERQAAARSLAQQQVDFDIALRVLGGPRHRRGLDADEYAGF